ncbi:MAG TPA: primosomal protein N' [Smithellaceae bacterium]|nr:primosomal protein N' [Smithellaceae bacterium]
MYVTVALNIPADKCFTYRVPAPLRAQAQIGQRVFVPLGNRRRTGFLVGFDNDPNSENIKDILEILDAEPLFDANDLRFYRWIADYFIYPLGQTLADLIPSGAEKRDLRWVTPLEPQDTPPLSAGQMTLLRTVQTFPRGLALSRLARLAGMKNAARTAESLQKLGLLSVSEKQQQSLAARTRNIIGLTTDPAPEGSLTARQTEIIRYLGASGPVAVGRLVAETGVSPSVIHRLEEKGLIVISREERIDPASFHSVLQSPPRGRIRLSDAQSRAFQDLQNRIRDGVFCPVLLHGVTGSGKTEVYLCAIEAALKQGGTAIYLVPEIALTPQLISRVSGRFDPNRIAVIHSGISERVRYDQWRQIRRGRISLVIGARSALFAPLPDLKLLIVDEEHDSSYKQDERLCYSARDLAVVKAKMQNAVVVMGSATPAVRTYHNALTNKYRLLKLEKRINDIPLPRIEIVDMKTQKEAFGRPPLLSEPLLSAVGETLSRKEQVLLFLNKRGFDTFLVCAGCGHPFHCPHCAVAMKSHPSEHLIKCHYCDYTQKAMPLCPVCKGSHILTYGAGTQKLESELEKCFPTARIKRMDSDTTARTGAQEKILYALEQRQIDILVGTQMVTKGHDFPFITLVGVVAADTALNMPDFRAAERTFQMLTQVAGRGGRGDKAGRVIIQTFNPDHYAIRHARNHDYSSFYEEEIRQRRDLLYPPFSQIVNLRLSSAREDLLAQTARELGADARTLCARIDPKAEIIGPAPAPLSKIRGRYRWQMLIKGPRIRTLQQIASALVEKHAAACVRLTIDVDPENFM